jgi:hypothetical protein
MVSKWRLWQFSLMEVLLRCSVQPKQSPSAFDGEGLFSACIGV